MAKTIILTMTDYKGPPSYYWVPQHWYDWVLKPDYSSIPQDMYDDYVLDHGAIDIKTDLAHVLASDKHYIGYSTVELANWMLENPCDGIIDIQGMWY